MGYRSSDGGWKIGCVMIIVFLLVAIGIDACMGSIPREETVVTAMESAGYSNVQVIGRTNVLVTLVGCDSGDATKFDVVAVSANGEIVKNAFVCVGWPFKGATIRYKP